MRQESSSVESQPTQSDPQLFEGDFEQQLRAQTYNLLAALMAAPPDEALLESLESIEISDADRSNPMAPVWESMKLSATATSPEALEDEYHDLFIGLGRGELVPYASWYLTGFLMEKPLAVLRSHLEELGIERQQGVFEPEDNAAALCECMSMIITNRSEIDFNRQRTFFEDHVEPWMEQFFKDLKEARSARFYRAVGQFGEEFIRLEKRFFFHAGVSLYVI